MGIYLLLSTLPTSLGSAKRHNPEKKPNHDDPYNRQEDKSQHAQPSMNTLSQAQMQGASAAVNPNPLVNPGSRRGLFLTFEGPDGSGKTTQLERLARRLRAAGLPILTTRQPGGTALGDALRALLVGSATAASPEVAIAPRAELALMFADRAHSLATVIEPALAAGTTVLCDRFTDSTEAYQGGGRELGSEIVLDLHHTLCGNIVPDRTILLLPPLARALARARHRNTDHLVESGVDESRFEQEGDPFFHRVAAAYERIADREPQRVTLIRDDASIDAIEARVQAALATLFPGVLTP